jgi:hypothetical protein
MARENNEVGLIKQLAEILLLKERKTRSKKQRYAPRDHLHINNDCPKTALHCVNK